MPQLPSSWFRGGWFPSMMCVVFQNSSEGSSPVPSRVTSFGHIHPFAAAFSVSRPNSPTSADEHPARRSLSQALLLRGPDPALSVQRPLAVDTVTDGEEAGGARSRGRRRGAGSESPRSGLRSRRGHTRAVLCAGSGPTGGLGLLVGRSLFTGRF